MGVESLRWILKALMGMNGLEWVWMTSDECGWPEMDEEGLKWL